MSKSKTVNNISEKFARYKVPIILLLSIFVIFVILVAYSRNNKPPHLFSSSSLIAATTTATTSIDDEAVVTIVSQDLKATQQDTILLIKSLLIHTSIPLQLNIICDRDSKDYLVKNVIMNMHTLNHKVQFNLLIYDPSWVGNMLTRMKIKTKSGFDPKIKLLLPRLLPYTRRSIVLDSSTLVTVDIRMLWEQFDKLTSDGMIAWYAPDPSNPHSVSMSVMLWNFEQSRTLFWEREMTPHAYEKYLGKLPDGYYSSKYPNIPQAYLWAVYKVYPSLFKNLELSFHLSNCENYHSIQGMSMEKDRFTTFPGIIVFDCMHTKYERAKQWQWAKDYYKWYRFDWLSRAYAQKSTITNVNFDILDMPTSLAPFA